MKNDTSTTRRKPNAGSFKPGADPRRHVHSPTCGHKLHQFTPAEASRGFWSAIAVWGVGIGQKLNASGRWPGYQQRRPAR